MNEKFQKDGGSSVGYNKHFSRVVFTREVTGEQLCDYMRQLTGKTEREIQRLLEQFAREIEANCPYIPGREPRE